MQHLKPIRLLLDPFLSSVALEISTKVITNSIKSTRLAEKVIRQHDNIKYFPDLNDIVIEKCRIREGRQKFTQGRDKIVVNILTIFIQKENREFSLASKTKLLL